MARARCFPFELALRALAATCVIAMALLPAAVSANSPSNQVALILPDYPVPPRSDTLLFYLQRSNNSNTVVYEANLRKNGELDHDKPVKVYWIRYNTNGERRALKTSERLFAFGVVSEKIRQNEFFVHLVSYEERKARVFIDKDGKPRATMEISGRPALLRWAYVTVDTDGVTPSVLRVDLFGEDLATGETLHERFMPRDTKTVDAQRPE